MWFRDRVDGTSQEWAAVQQSPWVSYSHPSASQQSEDGCQVRSPSQRLALAVVVVAAGDKVAAGLTKPKGSGCRNASFKKVAEPSMALWSSCCSDTGGERRIKKAGNGTFASLA